MDKNSLLKKIFTKKTQDYTFIIMFLLIFSIFIAFAIAPSLRTAFSLNKEEKDLEEVDRVYEQQIMNIAEIQMQMEENRDDLPLLNQAVSRYPAVNKMVDDLKKVADNNSFVIQRANIADVNLTMTKKDIDKVTLTVEGSAGFENLQQFVNDIFAQRRLKAIKTMTITKEKGSTASGTLNVVMTIEGYYL